MSYTSEIAILSTWTLSHQGHLSHPSKPLAGLCVLTLEAQPEAQGVPASGFTGGKPGHQARPPGQNPHSDSTPIGSHTEVSYAY